MSFMIQHFGAAIMGIKYYIFTNFSFSDSSSSKKSLNLWLIFIYFVVIDVFDATRVEAGRLVKVMKV